MYITRPPMGWNSWNTFGENIDEKMIMETADTMVKEGLLDCGYNYLVIDDCWSLKERDENGKLVADPAKFPHGMKAVADYVHSKGLKFGMYSCAGGITCAGYPGSYQHEFDDAETFASWGVDFLKYDYCFHDGGVPGEVLYRRMGLALANCGRDILYSACNWGTDNSPEWIKTTGAHMWRSTLDILDTWSSIDKLTTQQFDKLKTNGQGCFNDMDMLVVGMNGKGNPGVVQDDGAMTYEEYKTHFSVWSLFGSPLMLGCDIRNMTEETKSILTNKDIIAIQQDPGYRQPFVVRRGKFFFASRFLDNGDIAIGVFNMEDRPVSRWEGFMNLGVCGLTRESGRTLHLKELWTGEEKDVINEILYLDYLAPHACKVYRASLKEI